jgi:hypothetical protein
MVRLGIAAIMTTFVAPGIDLDATCGVVAAAPPSADKT